MISDFVLALFLLAIAANVIALTRYLRMLRVLETILESLDQTQKQFNLHLTEELNKAEAESKANDPASNPSRPHRLDNDKQLPRLSSEVLERIYPRPTAPGDEH